MNESIQHKLSRVRPPRVQITYDVEIGDAIEKKELPLVVGIMADLSGDNNKELDEVKTRKFIDIDRDNFTQVMAAQQPELTIQPSDLLAKYELSMVKRIEKLALLANTVDKETGKIFKDTGCFDELSKLTLVMLEGATDSSDKNTLFDFNKKADEYSALDDQISQLLMATKHFFASYIPLKPKVNSDFNENIKTALNAILAMVGAGANSSEFNTVLAALKKEKGEQRPFNFKFNNLDDFSPVSLIKQDKTFQAITNKKQHLFDLLQKFESNPFIQWLCKKVIQFEDNVNGDVTDLDTIKTATKTISGTLCEKTFSRIIDEQLSDATQRETIKGLIPKTDGPEYTDVILPDGTFERINKICAESPQKTFPKTANLAFLDFFTIGITDDLDNYLVSALDHIGESDTRLADALIDALKAYKDAPDDEAPVGTAIEGIYNQYTAAFVSEQTEGSNSLLDTIPKVQSLFNPLVEGGKFQAAYILTILEELVSEVKDHYIMFPTDQGQGNTEPETSEVINLLINRIADINEQLSNQVDVILHDPVFQKLEASWRGLNYLVMNTETGVRLKLRLLNMSREELQDDLEKAIEFDQSQLFKKVYEAEYGTFGGQPYSLLLGDYEFGRSPQDIALLTLISGVAAAAHAPFISAASANLFDMEDFTELARPRDLSGLFESKELVKWNAFRKSEDSRYVALTLPHVMMRLPYDPVSNPLQGFDYQEDTDGGKQANFLWTNAAYAKVLRITSAFAKYSWCAAIRGMEGGGAVTDLPVYLYRSRSGDQEMVCPTEIAITDRREKELSDLGFIALVHRKSEDLSVFFGGQTTQRFKVYDTPEATANARLSAILPYMLASSRFAHYLKVIVRDKVGGFLTSENVQEYLNRWINNYVLAKDDSGQEVKAQYPLREARVDVFDVPGKPGVYTAVAYLRPHFQMEELTTSIRLVAELPASAA